VTAPINTYLSKICYLIAIIFAVIASFGHAVGSFQVGWLAIVFIAAGLLLA